METFSVLLAIYAGKSPVISHTKASDAELFFDLHLNKRLSKQWWGWWFETLLHPLCRHIWVKCARGKLIIAILRNLPFYVSNI